MAGFGDCLQMFVLCFFMILYNSGVFCCFFCDVCFISVTFDVFL